MLPPDTFWYFIILFGINIICATHLLFTYNRTPIILFNVLVFVMLAARCCTEYYLPQVDDFQVASNIASVHSLLTVWSGAIIYVCTWWYIRPFKGYQYENQINWSFTFLIISSRLVFAPAMLNRKIWKFFPEKIDGYWQFYTDYDQVETYLYNIILVIFSLIIAWVLLKALLRDKRPQWDKWLLFLIFCSMTYLVIYDTIVAVDDGINYQIPNAVIFHMVYPLIANRFFTDYRFFQDTSLDVIGDSFNAISDLVFFSKIDLIIRQSNVAAKAVFYIKNDTTSLPNLLANNSQMLFSEAEILVKDLLLNLNKKQELILNVDGEERVFLISVSEYYKKKQLFGYTFFLKDITEKHRKARLIQKQHEELVTLNNTKDRIFEILGKDLRQPALAFRGLGIKVNELLQDEDYEQLNSLGESVEREAFKLNKLTDNLLNWALIQKNIMPYNPKRIPVKSIVDEILFVFERSAGKKEIYLSAIVAEELQVYADYNSVFIILRNLIDNAIKFTNKGGRVELLTEKEEGVIRIQVTDTGVGIAQQSLDKIFRLTEGKEQLGTAGEEGTGLGLHLIKELIQINQGTIKVESRFGVGTSVGITLPSAQLHLV